MIVKNPILPGFYPDPSICVQGNYFYLVTSSFAYFPGVPIFRSKDLKNWKQIGNILDRPSQLPLGNASLSQGIFAPTIRCWKKKFYMITTNVSCGGNFIVTADKPEGPWSDPYIIEGAAGIDPSLFFDDDGTSYYVGTRPNPEGVKHNGDWCIYVQKIDLKKMCLVGDYQIIWQGALRDAIWPEGPHLYKRNGLYYLVHAEGGTGPDHAVCVARSESVFGPYVGNPKNPIMTHRQLGSNYPVRYVGHADLVEAPNGLWYAVMLGSRPCEGHSGLGRETFLASVIWEEDWPVMNPGFGRLTSYQEVFLPEDRHSYGLIHQSYSGKFIFKEENLDFHFVTLRKDGKLFYSLTDNPGKLRMKLQGITLEEKASPSYVGFRQQHYFYIAEAKLEFEPKQDGECAGMAILQSEDAHVYFVAEQCNGIQYLNVYKKTKGAQRVLIASQNLDDERAAATDSNTENSSARPLFLRMVQKGQRLSTLYSLDGKRYHTAAEGIDCTELSTEKAGGFTGNTIGMYCSSNGKESQTYADYEYFSYYPETTGLAESFYNWDARNDLEANL